MKEQIFNDRRIRLERRHASEVHGWHLCRRKMYDRREGKAQNTSDHWWLHTNYVVSDHSNSH